MVIRVNMDFILFLFLAFTAGKCSHKSGSVFDTVTAGLSDGMQINTSVVLSSHVSKLGLRTFVGIISSFNAVLSLRTALVKVLNLCLIVGFALISVDMIYFTR